MFAGLACKTLRSQSNLRQRPPASKFAFIVLQIEVALGIKIAACLLQLYPKGEQRIGIGSACLLATRATFFHIEPGSYGDIDMVAIHNRRKGLLRCGHQKLPLIATNVRSIPWQTGAVYSRSAIPTMKTSVLSHLQSEKGVRFS